MALYQAKSDGRAVWRFFEPRMETRARERRNLEFELRLALENEELDIAFQPIYNVAKGEFLGCEALLRWRHPVRRPDLARRVRADRRGDRTWSSSSTNGCCAEACRAAMAWPRTPRSRSIFRRSISDHRDHFDGLFSSGRVPWPAPQRLEIEITESALLQNKQLARAIISDLRKLGVRISLDDFGTLADSSLSYLHSLPLNKIKIDRSFLNGLEANARGAETALRGDEVEQGPRSDHRRRRGRN